ncbi:unnamed protein product [Dicrocoelium dendriticum]|nr:unnamed protein product [Dicrocoelium dendriticum]
MSNQAVHSSSPASIWSPRSSFRLACFNIRTLLQIGQQAPLARTLETLSIDICRLSETRLQDGSTVLTLRSPSGDASSIFSLRLSGNDAASSTGQAGVGIALSPLIEAALVDWIPISSRMCAVRLAGSFKALKSRGTNRCVFIITAYAPTNCSDDSVKNDFYRQLTQLLRRRRSTDTVVQAGDLNAQVGKLSTDEMHLGGQHGVGSCNDNAGKSSCGMSNSQHGHWVTSQSLELIDAHLHIPAGSEHNESRKELRAKLRASLKRDRESWWSHRASEMEVATALGNHSKLFRLIRETGSRGPGVGETIRGESGQPIHNLSKRLERWAEHFEKQFNRLELFDSSRATDRPAPWAVPLDPPSRSEV